MKILEAIPQPGFRLRVRFDDGTTGVADLNHLAGRGVFSIWNEPGVFEQVQITPMGSLSWPGEVDLCADSIYLAITGLSPDTLFTSPAPPARALVID